MGTETVPSNLKFTEDHEWARARDGGDVRVGITHHAQDVLGDVVYVELPDAGTEVEAGEEFGLVESVKATSSVYAPVSGTVRRVNENVADSPELLNDDPYEQGWMLDIEPSNPDELDELLNAGEYKRLTEQA